MTPAPPGEFQVEISPALWLAIKNTERGLTGPGPRGLLRLEAKLAPDASATALDGFLAERGGSRAGKHGSRGVLLDIPAMYAPELWLHPAVARLEPADQAKNAHDSTATSKYLAVAALAALFALTVWMGLEHYQAATRENPSSAGEKTRPSRPADPKHQPARPLPGEGPIALASKAAPQMKPAATTDPPVQAEKADPATAKATAAKPAEDKQKTSGPAEAAGQKAMEAMWEGNAQKAAALLRKALEKNPGHLGLRTNLGLAFMELGRLDEAEAQFKEVLRQKPGDQEALSALQLIEQAKKD